MFVCGGEFMGEIKRELHDMIDRITDKGVLLYLFEFIRLKFLKN